MADKKSDGSDMTMTRGGDTGLGFGTVKRPAKIADVAAARKKSDEDEAKRAKENRAKQTPEGSS